MIEDRGENGFYFTRKYNLELEEIRNRSLVFVFSSS